MHHVVAFHSAVVRASAVVRVSPDCQAAFAWLLVVRASPCWMSRATYGWLPDYLVQIARLTRYINGPMPYAFILCFVAAIIQSSDLCGGQSNFIHSRRISDTCEAVGLVTRVVASLKNCMTQSPLKSPYKLSLIDILC